MRLLFLLLVLGPCQFAVAAESADSVPVDCRQIVVVSTAKWESTRGSVRRFERARGGAPWRQIGPTREALLGEHGLAWGAGLHVARRDAAPRKREGDRRAPAGLFRLTTAFGFAPASRLGVARFPYRQISVGMEAVEDPASRFYNQIVQRGRVQTPDWKSSERMSEIPDYELGVVVEHNPQNIPGAGSCIFIHQWRGDRTGTAGCTVLHPPHLLELVRWLDETKHPILLQLPRSEMPPGF
ncbi:MAG: L,D-transpeptidase family protein [Chthoniobacteraceae bacterium]